MKRPAFLLAALVLSTPVAAQVATVPVHSIWQKWTPDITLSLSLSLYGYTTTSAIPQMLSQQTVKVAPITLLQPEIRAEFPGYSNQGMTVMQLVVKANADAPSFQSASETVTPKTPLSLSVPAGKKLWVVYAANADKAGELKFYVGNPPPGATTPASASGTSLPGAAAIVDASGDKWTLGAVVAGYTPQSFEVLRNGTRFMGQRAERVYYKNGTVFIYTKTWGWESFANGKWTVVADPTKA